MPVEDVALMCGHSRTAVVVKYDAITMSVVDSNSTHVHCVAIVAEVDRFDLRCCCESVWRCVAGVCCGPKWRLVSRDMTRDCLRTH